MDTFTKYNIIQTKFNLLFFVVIKQILNYKIPFKCLLPLRCTASTVTLSKIGLCSQIRHVKLKNKHITDV